MKKLVSLILCLAMAMAWLPVGSPFAAAADSPFDGGSGTAEDPYLVSTPEQLKAVEDYSSSHFLQTNDIDLSDVSGMGQISIGEGGVYDGGGNCITGYKNIGSFFGENSGTIQNLGMRDIEITYVDSPSGQHRTYTFGGMVSTNNGTIHGCYVDNVEIHIHITMKATHNFSSLTLDVGGLAGVNSGTISCSYVSGSVYGYGTCTPTGAPGSEAGASVSVGGISGKNATRVNEPGTIYNCYSMAGVSGNGNCGALSGFSGNTITKSYYLRGYPVGTGSGTLDAVYKSAEEMGSAEFAAELEENHPDCSWEQKVDSDGKSQVVQTMQNLTVSADHPSGMYHMPIMVGITSDRSPDSDLLYYSIDGETEGWQPYEGPITLDQDAVIRVRAEHSGNPNAYRISTFRYKAAKYPVEASPAPGTYTTVPQTITLTTQTPGAEIYYTLDGTTPTSSSTVYKTPFFIFKNTTVTAAAKVGDEWGDPLSFTYKISPEITADKPGGNYTEPFTVKLMSTVPEYEIYYTVDGPSDPTVYGKKYDPDQGIEIYKTSTLRVASTFEEEWSDVTIFQYDFPTPVITPSVEAGEHSDVVHLTLECDTPYVTLSYRAPGVIEQETVYKTGDVIDIYKTATLTVDAKYKDQGVTWESWDYILPEPEIVAEPGAGAYNGVQTVTLRSNIPSYQLYYTLDGGDPATEGVLYSKPFELDHSADLKVCAKYGEHVVKTDSFSYDLSAVPSVTAEPAAGDITAPSTITLTAPIRFYTIYYTTDGSDPKTSPTRSKGAGEVQIRIEDPEPISIRAVPELNGIYGTTSTFRYTFSSQRLAMEKTKLEKRTGYEITFTVTNTLLQDKTVDFYAAAYQNGKMLGSSVESMELPTGTEKKSVTLHYPSVDQLPADAQFKVFCLDSKTRRPYCEPLTYEVSEGKVIQELASISVNPDSIVGQVGEVFDWPTVTAHYINGKPDAVVSAVVQADRNIVISHSFEKYVSIVKEGEGFITVSYSEDGITKSVEVPVTGVAPVVNLGFLANPEADSLPEGAIPISSAEDLAAIKSADSVGKTYYLTNDIQLTGEWEPIYGFQGTLDGRGHKISGLYISFSSQQLLAGLFASAYDAVFKNLAVEIDPRGVSAYNATNKVDSTCAAGLVGHSKNTDFINCYTTGGPISATGIGPCAGGLVGYLVNAPENKVVNCFSNCAVSAEGLQVTYTNYCVAGGLIGDLKSQSSYQTTSISRCYATGDVSLTYPGGTSGGGGTLAGGLVAQGILVKLTDYFALGDVSARKSVDYNSTSAVSAGGLGGWLMDSELTRCYSVSDVTSAGNGSVAGGLLAAKAKSIIDCYRANNTWAESYYKGGTQLTWPYFRNSFSGFDFNSTWQFTQGTFRGLPHLQYQD